MLLYLTPRLTPPRLSDYQHTRSQPLAILRSLAYHLRRIVRSNLRVLLPPAAPDPGFRPTMVPRIRDAGRSWVHGEENRALE